MVGELGDVLELADDGGAGQSSAAGEVRYGMAGFLTLEPAGEAGAVRRVVVMAAFEGDSADLA